MLVRARLICQFPVTFSGVGDHLASHESSRGAWRGSSSWYLGVISTISSEKKSLALEFQTNYLIENNRFVLWYPSPPQLNT